MGIWPLGGLIWGITRVSAKSLYLAIKFYLDARLYGKYCYVIMIYGLYFATNRAEMHFLRVLTLVLLCFSAGVRRRGLQF